jgi:hypothetical protein
MPFFSFLSSFISLSLFFLTFFPPLYLLSISFPLSISLCLYVCLRFFISLFLLVSQFQTSPDVNAHIYHHRTLALQKPPFTYAITISWRSKIHCSHLPSLEVGVPKVDVHLTICKMQPTRLQLKWEGLSLAFQARFDLFKTQHISFLWTHLSHFFLLWTSLNIFYFF